MLSKCKKWLIIPVFAIILMSHNAFAVEPSVNVEFTGGAIQPYWQSSNGEAFHNTSLSVGNNVTYSGMTYIRVRNGSNQNYAVEGGSYVSLIGEVILRAHNTNGGGTAIASWASGYFGMSNDTSHTDCGMVDFKYDLQEYSQTTSPNEYYYRYTVEMICRVQTAGATNPTTNFNLSTTGSAGSVVASFNLRRISVFKPVGDFDPSTIISAINRLNTTIDGIVDKFDDLQDVIEQGQQQEQDATDNIENQDYHDLQGDTDNSQTTSLIGSLSGFLSAISSLSATNCNVALQFPQFAGGTMTVNVCQNKEYTGNIVSVAGSVLLVLFYLPLAFVMVNMIYREIRSFTNG